LTNNLFVKLKIGAVGRAHVGVRLPLRQRSVGIGADAAVPRFVERAAVYRMFLRYSRYFETFKKMWATALRYCPADVGRTPSSGWWSAGNFV